MVIDEMPLNAGVVFERTYDILLEKMQNGVKRLAMGDKTASVEAALLISIAVNGAFASELYMKSMLPGGIQGHKLDVLYGDLSEDIQQSIKIKTVENMLKLPGGIGYDDTKFDSDLQVMGHSFVEWRYFYQYNPHQASPQFYKALMVAVREVATEEMKREKGE